MNKECDICFKPMVGGHMEFKKAWFYNDKYIGRMNICVYCEQAIREASVKARRKRNESNTCA